jgi:hypothetical protein
MNTRILERMIQGETFGSRCKENMCHNTHLHIAVIVKNNQVLATAENRIGTRSRGSGYSNQTIHAERAVFKKLGDYTKLRGATLCVWRVSSLNVLPSKPCSDCHIFLQKCMREYGLRAVQYTDTIIPL